MGGGSTGLQEKRKDPKANKRIIHTWNLKRHSYKV